jgi:hypothetical protein
MSVGDPVALTMRFPFSPTLADPVGWPDEVYFDHYKAMMHEQLEEINKIKTPPVGISLDAA